MREIPEFRLFIKPGCPWCVEVINYLRQRGYRFDLVDVLMDADGFEEMKRLSGQRKTPTMQVGHDGPVLADFGVEELVPFLAENGLD